MVRMVGLVVALVAGGIIVVLIVVGRTVDGTGVVGAIVVFCGITLVSEKEKVET